ncbi:MAG TPA: ABC transporter ATP-binding protein [Clostridiales bacterium]|nr:ABC transporter ATP-binding protein [Clostridiales bacterium]
MDIIKRILAYSGKYRKKLISAVILLTLLIAVNLLTPHISRIIVDDVVEGGRRQLLPVLLALLLLASLTKGAALYLRSCLFESYAQDCLYDLRNDMYTHLQGLPFSYYDNNRVGELMSRMTGDLEGIRIFLSAGIPILLENAVYFIGTTIILFIMNARLAVITLSVMPLIAYGAYRFNRFIRPRFNEIREQQAVLNTAAQENIAGVRVVKAFAREQYEIEKFDAENDKNREFQIKASKLWGNYFPVMDFLSSAALVIMIWAGGRMVGAGQLSLGTIVAFNGYLWMLIMPMRMLGWIMNMMAQAITSGRRVFEVLDTGSTIREKENPHNPEDFQGEVTFKNVSFRYRQQLVLKDLDFHVPAGSTVAIMGATGSGKTSIINLILRFYDRSEGEVLIDGVDVKDWNLRRLRSETGIIMQDTFLFSDTIEGNILYGKTDADREEVIQAAKMADAHEFIMEMPMGYDTIVGERGVGLSGGQRQRIAIARAIIKNPKILIMDDCTSAVDMETEHKIQTALKELQESRTTFIIAHRVSSVRNADMILMLENGRIVERGNHQQLMEAKGLYYNMVKQQYKDFDNINWDEVAGRDENYAAAVRQKGTEQARRKVKVI